MSLNALDLLDRYGRERTPLVRQVETSECGLACLAMVAASHGFTTDLPTMRRHFGTSLRGATLRSLMETAERIGLSARPVRSEPMTLRGVRLPAILHWDLNHFVVLDEVRSSIRGTRYVILDPAHGRVVMPVEELSKHFTGVAIEFTKNVGFSPQRERPRLRISQLWSGVRGLGASIAGVLVLSIILQAVSLAMPFYLQLAVDTVLPTSDTQLLRMLAIGFGGLALVSLITGWLRSNALLDMTSAFSFQIIDNLYRHLLSLPLAWFERRHVGDVISRFGSTQPIAGFLSQGVVSKLIDGGMAIVTLIIMFVYSPLLATVALTAFCGLALVKAASFATMKRVNADSITTSARENSAFIESVRGAPTLKAFGQEANRRRSWQILKASSVNAQLRLGRLASFFDAGSSGVLVIERILFVYLAVGMAMSGGFSVGMIFAFQAYKSQFLEAGGRLVEQMLTYRLLDVHLDRLSDIALSRAEPDVGSGTTMLEPMGGLELRHVSYSCGHAEAAILRNVSLHVAAGEMIALVGPSGGGKTTLIKILLGLIEPSAGSVLIDGRPLKSVGARNWRERCGSVLQEDQLFAGTLAENVAFFDPEIDMDHVADCCREAAVMADIERMPLGLDTLVGDMGSALSGGQRQRLMLARALYRRPVALFMDEGTANLDPASETTVVEAVARLRATRVVSAHRPAAAQAASRIFLVAGGTVRELRRDAAPGREGEVGGRAAATSSAEVGERISTG